MKIEISAHRFNLVMAFILFGLLPFHVVTMYFLAFKFGYNIDDPKFILIKSWKEFLLIGVLFIHVFYKISTASLKQFRLCKTDLILMFFALFGFVFVVMADNLSIAVWSFRSLYYAYLFYVLGRIQGFRLKEFHTFLQMMYIIAVITAVFGVIQVEYFGAEWHALAFGVEEVSYVYTAIDYEKLRASSTFISTHEFGLFLVIMIFSIPFLITKEFCRSNKVRVLILIGGLIILVGLAYSVSRSSFLILILGLAFVGFRQKKYFVLLVLGSAIMVLLLYLIGAFSNFESVSSGTDPSSHSHQWVIQEALRRTALNPLGVGLGEVGVVVRRFKPEAPQYEGEWFNILVQMGVIGGLIALGILAYIFFKAYKFYTLKTFPASVRDLSLLITLIVLALGVRDMVLPRDQMNYSLGWFLIGCYMTFRKEQLKDILIPQTKLSDF